MSRQHEVSMLLIGQIIIRKAASVWVRLLYSYRILGSVFFYLYLCVSYFNIKNYGDNYTDIRFNFKQGDAAP